MKRSRSGSVRRGVAVLTCCAVTTLGWASEASGGRVLEAQDTAPRSQVGVLIPKSHSSGTGGHICTASVVHSASGDLVLTAAHCVTGRGTELTFVPAYEDGKRPEGTWSVTAAYVAPEWKSGQEPHDDYAFLRVADQKRGGKNATLESVTGAFQLGTDQVTGETIEAVAYNNSSDAPVACAAPVVDHGVGPSFHCDGFESGSSGSPWTAAPKATGDTKRPTVVGVIGGHHQGGCVSHTSFSAPFTATALALLDRAQAGGPGDDVPAPGSDGCGL